MLASGPFISCRAALPALAVACVLPASGQATKCTVGPTNYKGWNAQQLQNEWVTLTFVPQAGGRLMQVTFGPRSYFSPLVALQPGDTYALDTEWYPARAGRDFLGVTTSGLIAEHLRVSGAVGAAKLTGTFGVFFPGKIVAKFLDKDSKQISETTLRNATPLESVKLDDKVLIPGAAVGVALHLIDSQGRDRGTLDEVSMPGETLE